MSLRADAPVFVPSFPLADASPASSARNRQRRRRNKKQTDRRRPRQQEQSQQQHHQENQTRRAPRQVRSKGRSQSSNCDESGRKQQRRRRNPRNNRHVRESAIHEYKTIDQPHNDDEPLILEASFPPLISETQATTISSFQECQEWSVIALNAHRSLEEEKCLQQEHEQRRLEQVHNSTVRLTPLTSLQAREVDSRAVQSKQHQTENNDIFDTTAIEGNEPDTSSKLRNRTAVRLDMTKLRDRWWQLLREKRQRDSQAEQPARLRKQQQAEKEESDNDSSSVVTSSSDSSYSCTSTDDVDQYDRHDIQHEDDTAVHAMEKYLSSPYPLHQAIIDEDVTCITRLLSMKVSRVRVDACVERKMLLGLDNSVKLQSMHLLSPLHLAVYLDRPHIVKLLLDTSIPSLTVTNSADEKNRTPLMLASELGLDGCIRILFAYGAPVHTKDTTMGNTALHYACQAGAPASTLRLLLGKAGGGGGQQQRLALSKNQRGQTPLHVACEHGHDHLVQVFLSICSASLLSKVLRIQDSFGQTPLLAAIGTGSTDVVMSLLMWRGNDHSVRQQQQWRPIQKNESSDAPTVTCPLVWAVSKGSIDMVDLLLEFSDSSPTSSTSNNGGYNLVGALRVAAQSSHQARLEIIRVLVHSGASPCAESLLREKANNSNSLVTPISVAASKGDVEALTVMLDTFEITRAAAIMARRHDPKLKRQPDSYFDAIEARDNLEVNTALCDGLVRSLFLGWRNGGSDLGLRCLGCAVVLLKKGATLNQAGYDRLKCSIASNTMKPPAEVSDKSGWYRFEAKYNHYGEPGSGEWRDTSTYGSSAMGFWSTALCKMPWMVAESGVLCSWLKGEIVNKAYGADEAHGKDHDVVLVAGDERFLVHSDIVSLKSAKLAAAIRFASMKQSHEHSEPVEVHVGLSTKMCKWLLQHIYHGSIASGWDHVRLTCCKDLLELSLCAEEFLCPSLLRECEMRLLASDPLQCFCWSCCTSVRNLGFLPENVPSVECLYRVRGPSHLLTADSALDALAVSQQLGALQDDHFLKFWPLDKIPSNHNLSDDTMWREHVTNDWKTWLPFVAVKEASIKVMFKEFCAVVRSESYASHVEAMLEEDDTEKSVAHRQQEAQSILLQLFLEELAASPLLEVLKDWRKKRIDTKAETKSKQ